MRVYVPMTLEDLAACHRAQAVPAAEPGQERLVVAEEDEESEYAALVEAAGMVADLLARRGDPGARRAVVVAAPRAEADPDGALAWRDVVAVHADAPDGAAPGDDLGWYATQEVPFLLRGEV